MSAAHPPPNGRYQQPTGHAQRASDEECPYKLVLRAVAAVRRTLGDAAFAAAWHAGETMPADDALDDALSGAVSR